MGLVSGEESSWTLPLIDDGHATLEQVIIVPDPLISSSVTFEEDSLTVTFDGEVEVTEATFVFIEITIVNSVGESKYE